MMHASKGTGRLFYTYSNVMSGSSLKGNYKLVLIKGHVYSMDWIMDWIAGLD